MGMHATPSTLRLLVPAVFVTKVDPNYAQPWQMCIQRASTGSAFVTDSKRRLILTNSHVVGPWGAAVVDVGGATDSKRACMVGPWRALRCRFNSKRCLILSHG